MKRLCKLTIFAFVLSACMIINIHADNLNAPGSRNINVKLVDIELPVYDYDITWGDMNFIYTDVENYEFNSSTNEYDKVLSGSWESSSNSIEILNNSSLSINVTLSYVSDENNITGGFSVNNFELSKDESKTVSLTLSGSLNNSYSSYTKIGSVLMEVR